MYWSLTQFAQTVGKQFRCIFFYLAAVAAAYHSNTSNEHGNLEWRAIVTIFRVFTSQNDAVIRKSKRWSDERGIFIAVDHLMSRDR